MRCPLLSDLKVGDRLYIRLPAGYFESVVRVCDAGYLVAENSRGATIINRGFLERAGYSWFTPLQFEFNVMAAKHRHSESFPVQWNGNTCSHSIYGVPSHGKRYYRYVVNCGQKVVLSVHVPGGAIGNPTADARACEIGRHLYQGRSPDTIAALIQSWRGHRRK